MSRNITNKDCKLFHTEYCDLLNMQSCDACFVQERKEYDGVAADLDALKKLMPEEGVHSLFEDERCLFCKGEKRNPRAYYALLDLGHPEPKRTKRSALGLKVNCKAGSMLPLQISTCRPCRNRMLVLDYLPVLLPVIVGLLMLAAYMLPGVTDNMTKYSMLMPFALFAVMVLLSLVVSGLLKKSLRRKYARSMHVDVFELPLLAKLKDMGWFALSTSGTAVRVVFTKKRMRQGIGTGTPEDALANDVAFRASGSTEEKV